MINLHQMRYILLAIFYINSRCNEISFRPLQKLWRHMIHRFIWEGMQRMQQLVQHYNSRASTCLWMCGRCHLWLCWLGDELIVECVWQFCEALLMDQSAWGLPLMKMSRAWWQKMKREVGQGCLDPFTICIGHGRIIPWHANVSAERIVMNQPSFFRQLHHMISGFGTHTLGCFALTMILMSSSDLLFLQSLLPLTMYIATV